MRYLFSFILALQMSLFVCISSYAAVSATASDAVKVASGSEAVKVASGSEASRPSMLYSQVMDSVALYSDSDISLLSDSDLPSVSNTVDYHDLSLCVQYYDMSNNSKTKSIAFDSNYYASLSLPDDCAKPYRVYVRIGKSSLPAPGRYNMQIYFGSNTGVSYGKFRVFTAKNSDNAQQVSTETESLGTFTQSSGDWYYSVVLELGNISYITAGPYLSVQSNSFFPYGGFVKINFKQTSSDPVFTSAGGSYSSSDAAADTANNTAQLVEGQDNIIETIKEQISYIINQIAAFWDQLAGEFTNLFNKMNEQHSEDLEAWEQNANDIMDNQDSNTQTIINGYDSSGMDSDNQRLSEALTDYDQQESAVLDQVTGNLESFEYEDPFQHFAAPLEDISYFLTGVYDRLGSLNIPIGFSLTLTIAMLIIGYYRFKGGS